MIEFVKREDVKSEKGEAPRITENRELVAELVKVEPFQSKDHPDWAPSIKFIFRVLEDPFVGAFCSGLVPNDWRPGNKLDKWLKALGVDANVGDTLSSEQIKKAVVRVRIELNKEGFANAKGLEPMSDRDWTRVSPDAQKKPAHSVTVQQSVTKTETAPAPAAIQPQSAPSVSQPTISKDDSIPF